MRAHLKGGVAKCVLYACIGGEGVKKGPKTACALLVCPLVMILKIENFVENFLFNEIKIGGIDKNVKIVKMCAMCEILD